MSNSDLAQFLVQNAAYHEAGHTTAAVLQRMPLQERGMHVDSEGSGISYYYHRTPGNPANSEKDQIERERTIIALYAGMISQRRFLSELAAEKAWASDRTTIAALLDEMHRGNPLARSAAENGLREKVEELVCQNWPIIEALASALVASLGHMHPCRQLRSRRTGHTAKRKLKSGCVDMKLWSSSNSFRSLPASFLILPVSEKSRHRCPRPWTLGRTRGKHASETRMFWATS